MNKNNFIEIIKADEGDYKKILQLQKIAYQSEAKIYNDYSIPPLHQTIEEVKQESLKTTFLKASIEEKIIGSVRAYREKGTCFIGKLIVHPNYQNQGIGTLLMRKIEKIFSYVDRFELFTGYKSKKNLHLYHKLGYEIFKTEQLNENVKLHYLQKNNSKSINEKIKDHFEEVSTQYDEIISKVIPYYNEMLMALINSIPFEKDQQISIVDLGCGTGNLSELIRKHFPNSILTSIDISQNMIEIAKEKLSEFDNIQFIKEDFNSLSFISQYNVILSSLAIHHLRSDEDKVRLYKKVYNALSSDGVFYNLDNIRGSNKYLQEMYMREWIKYLKSNLSMDEINELLDDHRREDSPAILFNQLKWLENIGFKCVDVIWKDYYFAVYGGIK